MPKPLILLSVPALREKDVAAMPKLRSLMAGGEIAELVPGFPCVTCPVQAAMTTGRRPAEHGIVANGLYWREKRQVEMWTAPNDCIERPQIWDLLSHHGPGLTSAVWFPLHSKGCEADYVCTPAPIHNPDGSESLWCYTRPMELYGELRDALGHFPLMNYWGPMAGIKSSAWIADSAVIAARQWQPDFFYIYLPQLDYAAQRAGPDSAAAAGERRRAGRSDRTARPRGCAKPTATICSGSSPANTPSRRSITSAIRTASCARPACWPFARADDGEHARSGAKPGVCDGRSPVFARLRGRRRRDDCPACGRVCSAAEQGIAEVLVGTQRGRYQLEHPRSGDVILISSPQSWQAYYWWLSDDRAPRFARTVDIHRKPGYDPVELFFDPATKSIPLDAALVKGSHGAPAIDRSQRTVLLASEPTLFPAGPLNDTDVFGIVLRHFGLQE